MYYRKERHPTNCWEDGFSKAKIRTELGQEVRPGTGGFTPELKQARKLAPLKKNSPAGQFPTNGFSRRKSLQKRGVRGELRVSLVHTGKSTIRARSTPETHQPPGKFNRFHRYKQPQQVVPIKIGSSYLYLFCTSCTGTNRNDCNITTIPRNIRVKIRKSIKCARHFGKSSLTSNSRNLSTELGKLPRYTTFRKKNLIIIINYQFTKWILKC